MKAAVKYSIAGALVALFCAGMFFLYRQVRQEQREIVCGRLDVSFADSLRFVSEQDVREYLDAHYGTYIGQRLDSVQLARIEQMLETRSSVTRCQAWTSDDGVLHVEIAQRAPVLRFQDGNICRQTTKARPTIHTPEPGSTACSRCTVSFPLRATGSAASRTSRYVRAATSS